MLKTIDPNIIAKAKTWTNAPFDQETISTVNAMIEAGSDELVESFYTDLEFGTGGMRGIMGPGTNRINKYTLGAATQGLANYINLKVSGSKKVAIAYDSRNNSPYFAQLVADVFSANNIEVFLFEELRPTPELSFAIRHLNCTAGIVITASHNPPEYNGYKVYWEDGGQIVAPHDALIINEVRKLNIENVNFDAKPALIQKIGKEVDAIYLNLVKNLSINPEAIQAQNDMPIVYTSLHGTGITLIPDALKNLGFTNVHLVESQSKPDGNFPTVASPNPEERAALAEALTLAKTVGAEVVLGTDPDTDRVGVCVKGLDGEHLILNGNQAGAVLVYYLLKAKADTKTLPANAFVAKTVVTTELIKDIADGFGVRSYDTLTGFKHIAHLIQEKEGKEIFIGGGEESYGYLVGDFVRDKDAVISSVLFCEIAAWAKNNGKSFYDVLIDIYLDFGFYLEDLVSLTKKGKDGKEEIAKMMEGFRNSPPQTIDEEKVVSIIDHAAQSVQNTGGKTVPTNLPASNVMQFITESGSKITARPSGTEPKIKFYISMKSKLENKADFEKVNNAAKAKIARIKIELGL